MLAVAMASQMTSFSIAIWAAEKGGCSVISGASEDSVYDPIVGLASLVDAMMVAGLAGSGLPISSLNSSKACCSGLRELAHSRG